MVKIVGKKLPKISMLASIKISKLALNVEKNTSTATSSTKETRRNKIGLNKKLKPFIDYTGSRDPRGLLSYHISRTSKIRLI